MLNPDYIPPAIGIPAAIVLWLVLLAMILWDRRKLNKALRERPTLKVYDGRQWVDAGKDFAMKPSTTENPSAIKHRPVSNFYDQEKDHAG